MKARFFRWLSLTAFLLASVSAQAGSWLDRSHRIFLPPQANKQIAAYNDFPVFWWNFLVVELKDDDVPWGELQNACADWQQKFDREIQKSPCRLSIGSIGPMLADWMQDAPLRRPAPSVADLRRDMTAAMTKASFPLGADVLAVLRLDPIGGLDEYLTKLRAQQLLRMEEHQGFFWDAPTHRVLIPVQLSFAPTEADRLLPLQESSTELCAHIPGCESISWTGPHASALENELRVKDDMHVVSVVGILLLVILAAALSFTRRLRVLLLVPPLLLAITLATGLTVAVFGSIHGIVLAFGPGLVGLVMDYGLHSCFMGPNSRPTWIANLLGIATTGIVLVVMLFSQIPLVRELMFFSLAGLIIGFAFFYLLMNRFPDWFSSAPYGLQPPKNFWPGFLSVLLALASFGVFALHLNLDLAQMNFESPRTREIHRWLFGSNKSPTPILMIHDQSQALNRSAQENMWAKSQGIAYQGAALLLPPLTEQQKHLSDWKKLLCGPLKLTDAQKKFFEPFWSKVNCKSLQTRDLDSGPAYLQDLRAGTLWVSFFLPTTDEQMTQVKQFYPRAASARDLFSSVPATLLRELLWMLPISLLGAWLILLLYYSSLIPSLLAVIPFFTGLGAYAIASLIGHVPITFVSVIGLIMVFGMSLDYGVFVVNFIGRQDKHAGGVWSALSLCGYVTVAGFVPLLFAHHPVMFQLGHALTWGALGTYLGSVFGLPWLYRRWGKIA